MKNVKVFHLAGLYKITREVYFPSSVAGTAGNFQDESFNVNLTSQEARTLMKRKKNEDSLYSKLGFKEIILTERKY